MKTCWECKHFTHTGGHGSSDWGWCNLSNGSVESDDTCEKFAEICVNKNEYSIHTSFDRTNIHYPYKVITYWDGGSRSETRIFNSMEQAGDYIQKIEAFLKYRKD
jgi:hypothetical protein